MNRLLRIALPCLLLVACAADAPHALGTLERDRITLPAPVAERIAEIPVREGQTVAAGELLLVLEPERTAARVYVPESLRLRVAVGSVATVRLQGDDTARPGRVRAIRAEPSFTPYYALSGDDASRLSWLAEIELDADAARLPVGIPVRVEFPAAPDPVP